MAFLEYFGTLADTVTSAIIGSQAPAAGPDACVSCGSPGCTRCVAGCCVGF